MEGAPCVCRLESPKQMNAMNLKPSEAYRNNDFVGYNVILNVTHASFYPRAMAMGFESFLSTDSNLADHIEDLKT